MADKKMATRDELLCRLHDGELEPSAAHALRAELTASEQEKLHALAEVDALLRNTLTAEADAHAGTLNLWDALEARLPLAPPVQDTGKVLPFVRRRTVQATALLSTLAAAAGLVLMLRTVPHPSNRCDIEELEIAGQNATVITVPDEHDQKTTLIWFDHQETDVWESL